MSAVTTIASTQRVDLTTRGGFDADNMWALAACRGPQQEVFFPPTVSETRRAKRRREGLAKEICETCSIQVSCLATALKRNEQHGIWGGQTAKERRLTLAG